MSTFAPASTQAPPTVSVLMITYRHERFIAQAIESVLMQRTRFDVELVIGEDHSPDGTLALIREYEREHPTKIRVIARPTNVGMMQNFMDTYAQCRGRYIALLEGDDYWTDPDKLQIQVDHLEANPDWALCFHRVRWVDDEGEKVLRLSPFDGVAPVTTIDDLLKEYYVPTLSIVFRRDLLGAFPSWFGSFPVGDWPLTLLLARRGKLGYVERTMADYRVHDGGVWSGATMRARLHANLDMFRTLRPFLDADLGAKATDEIISRSISLAAFELDAREYGAAWKIASNLIRTESASRVAAPLMRALMRRLVKPLVRRPRWQTAMPQAVHRAIAHITRR